MNLMTNDEQNAYRNELEKLSGDELNARFEELAQEQSSKTFSYDEEFLIKLKVFFDEFEFNHIVQLAGAALTVYTKIKNSEEFTIGDIKSLQKILIESKWKSIKQAELLFGLLKGLESTNIELMNMDSKFRHLGEIIQRKQKELATGLQHKEGDVEASFIAEKSEESKMAKV